MRKFFQTILENLYIYCGNRQIEKMDDTEITALLDALCRVSEVYSYIPEEDQKSIIQKCLVEDKEYQNINARLVSKWLEINGKKFFQEIAHKETVYHEPATAEQRAHWLSEWQKELDKINTNFEIRPISRAELMRESFYQGDHTPTNYKPLSEEQVQKKELHRQYVKENYDKITGNALESWIPENEWLKKQKQV
jgi:hypothetical protein